ncbi:MAG: IS1595 family transposase [Rubrivivax sp.]|nr:IS1595 family transposase [Rubrivivax sp.]
MAMNRVQFQRGLSMAEFMQCDGSDERCEAALIAARWPQGFVCPDCDCAAHSSYRHEGRQCWQCSACRHPCSVTSGTVFEASKLRLSTWFLAMHLLTQSKNFISALELERHLGICYRTAWLVKHKLMEVMRLREEGRQLTGRVEIDDAYLGGQRCGGKAGRGSENKVSFIAAVQTTDDGQADPACLHLMPFTNAAMSDFAATSLVRPLTVVSDGLACFLAAGQAGVHERTVTGGGRQAAKLQQFRAVNTVLSNLKTGRAGTYHAFKFAKYAHRYLAEFQYRFNRRFNLRSILHRLVHVAGTTKPHGLGAIRG